MNRWLPKRYTSILHNNWYVFHSQYYTYMNFHIYVWRTRMLLSTMAWMNQVDRSWLSTNPRTKILNTNVQFYSMKVHDQEKRFQYSITGNNIMKLKRKSLLCLNTFKGTFSDPSTFFLTLLYYIYTQRACKSIWGGYSHLVWSGVCGCQ